MIIPKTADEAVRQYTPFVAKTARRFAGRGVTLEDLIQEGLIAVAKAFKAWSPTGGASMLTWIRRPVRNAMSRVVDEQRRAGGTGTGERSKKAPTRGVRLMSMDAPFSENGTYPDGAMEVGCLHDTVGVFVEPPDTFALRQLPGALATLNKTERQIIRMRFERDWTLERAGDALGFSRERARQVEAEALRKLRLVVKGDDDATFH